MSDLTFGSLFAGIGGMDLGLELAGMKCRWQVEIDPFCQQVLAMHWPDVPRFSDVREVRGDELGAVDVVAGGFPCQDISSARTNGARAGLDGDKSGLWSEFFRILVAVRPAWVIVENSPEHRRWMPSVRRDLARLGYQSVPLLLSAGSFGATHRRPRGFVVANSNGQGEPLSTIYEEVARLCPVSGQARRPFHPPVTVGVADGLSHRMDRLRTLGNAVVPQVAEWIGQQIMDSARPRDAQEHSR